MLAKVFTRTVEASFHRGDTRIENLGDFRMAAAFLHEGEERAVLRPQLRQRMPERVQLLRIDRAGRLGDVLVLLAKGQEDPAQLLPAQLVDAGVAREAEEPGLELRGGLEPVDRPDHLDENLLGEILHVVAASGHGVDETGHPVLVTDNKLPLSALVALLSSPDAAALSLLAGAHPALPNSSAVRERAAAVQTEFEAARDKAREAYEAAKTLFAAAGGSGDIKTRLDQINTSLENLNKAGTKADTAQPAADAAAEHGASDPAAAAKPAMSGESGKPGDKGDTGDTAALEAEIRAALAAMKADAQTGKPEAIIRHMAFKDDQQKALVEALLPMLSTGQAFNAACVDKFGKPFAQLVKESQSPAVKSNPILGPVGMFTGGGASALPGLGELTKFFSDDSHIRVISPSEAELTVDGVTQSLTAVKVGDAWKIQVDIGEGAGMAAGLMPMLQPIGQAIEAVTAGISEGKYSKPDDMLLDLSARLMGAMSGGLKPPGAGKPDAAPPAKPSGEPAPGGG